MQSYEQKTFLCINYLHEIESCQRAATSSKHALKTCVTGCSVRTLLKLTFV